MRYLILAITLLLCAAIPAHAQIGVGFRSHDVSISFHVSAYPRLVAIPGYPVYYDPRANSNYFFYDGLYWVFEDDNWYSSAWYDGPWDLVDPEYVPLFVLRVPVRYYRHRPAYFSGWSLNFAPRWGEHWGHDWEQHRSGWDRWDRHSVPRAAPLPSYQARYSGNRYPRAAEQQYSIQSRSYRYQPREQITRQYFQQRAATTGARIGTQQQVQTQQPTRVREQAQGQQRSRASQQRTEQRSRARDQGQAQQQTRATQQAQAEQRTRARGQAQAQQQTRATRQAPTEQRSRARDQAQAQQQTRAIQRAQTDQRSRAREQAQAQQQTRSNEQAQARQQTRAREQPQARQQQQQPSRGRDQVQQRGQQQATTPRAKGPSNQQQQQQQKKEKEDKKDSGGQGGQ